MANSEAVAGVDSYLLYAEETTYGTDPGSGYDTFGLVTSFKPTINNEVNKRRGFIGSSNGGRTVSNYVPGKLVVGATVDFDITHWAFLEFVMGTVAGSDPYTYTTASTPGSMTIHHAIDNPGGSSTDMDMTLLGAVVDSCTIKCAVGEPVTCSLSLVGSNSPYDTSLPSNVAQTHTDVFNFSGASLEIPDSTALDNIIDSVEITIKNNFEVLYGLGSRLGQNARPKELEYTIKFTMKYLDNDTMLKLLGATTPTDTGGPTENASLTLNFVNGTRSAIFSFTTFVIDEGSISGELNQLIGEDITGTASTLSVVEDRTT